MMGYSHAITGAAVWAAVAVPAGVVTGSGPTAVGGFAAGALVSAGAALLPDLDHRGATVSRALPPVTTLLAVLIGLVSGGHRKGTHSIVGIVGFGAVAWASGLWTMNVGGQTIHPGPALGAVVLTGLGLKAMRLWGNPGVAWLVSLATGAVVWFTLAPGDAGWFAVAVTVGVAVHIVGDMLTVNGCPLLWPVTVRPFRFPILGVTGSGLEKILVALCAASIVLSALTAVPTLLNGVPST